MSKDIRDMLEEHARRVVALEAENARLRAENKALHILSLKDAGKADDLRAELAQARKDGERLDWLEHNSTPPYSVWIFGKKGEGEGE